MITKKIDEYGDLIHLNELNLLHREDGPAVEYSNGEKEWYFNGLLHRVDGPALEYYTNYNTIHYIMGKNYSYKDWLAIKDFPLLW